MHVKLIRDPNASILQQLNALDPVVDSLDMSGLELHKLNTVEIITIIRAIPPGIRHLDLSLNHFYELTTGDLQQVYTAIGQKELHTLKLHHTGMTLIGDGNGPAHFRTTEELVQNISLLPRTLTTLDLSFNEFFRRTPEDFQAIFGASPTNATILDISSNGFQCIRAEELSQKLVTIPPTFDTLIFDLQPGNIPFERNYLAPNLRGTLMAIPQTIKTLDLAYTQLNKFSFDYLKQLKDALPSIITLCFHAGYINRMSTSQLDALVEIVPNAEHVIAKNDSMTIVTSKQINYLKSKIDSQTIKPALNAVYVLSELEKGVTSNKSGKKQTLPEDITSHISEFLSTSEGIKKGLNVLRQAEDKKPDKPVTPKL